ncbi:hypothetical protein ACQEVZ_52520 [Dactylosporangium sp. CA-152071]|uniref:hypothetical protein n=1 Tax=Dactylosporangium sp. CA-152071 TaxID=3239933 RepID=UPI003D8A827B
MRRGSVSAALLMALVVGAACGIGEALQDPGDPVDMTAETIAGTWHAGTDRFITFGADGTFTALNLPPGLFHRSPSGPAAEPIDASGRYVLAYQPAATAGPHASVRLIIEERTGADLGVGGVELSALRPGDGQVYLVFFYVGDQGNMTTGYLRCADACPPPASAGLGPAPRPS